MGNRKTSLLLKTLTFRKGWNFLQLMWSYHYSRLRRKPFHRGMPAKIGIEPTTSCNLRCPECPSGLRSFTRPTGMLQLASFKQMVDQVHRELVYLLLYFQGEPYLNPDFLDMAAYAAEKNVFTATSTNGHYLSVKNAERTVASGLHEVIVSVDGATQETYEAYRIGGQLDKVKKGIRNLVEARERAKSATPHIVLQFLVVGPNEHELEAIEKMGADLGVDKVVFKTAQIYDFEQGSPLIPQNDRYSRYRKGADGRYRLKNKLRNQCWKLWMGAEVTWDGKVLPCCFDKDGKYVMGELPQRDFKDIWQHADYQAFRGQILQGRKSIDICQNCTEGTQIFA